MNKKGLHLQTLVFFCDNQFICALLQGGVEGTEPDASLTAFILIAMQEGREICAPLVSVSIPLTSFCLPKH